MVYLDPWKNFLISSVNFPINLGKKDITKDLLNTVIF